MRIKWVSPRVLPAGSNTMAPLTPGESIACGQIVSQAGTVRSGHAQRLCHQMHGIIGLHRRETWPSAGLRTIAFLEGQRVAARCARGRSRYPSALRKSTRGRRPAIGQVERIAGDRRGRLSAHIDRSREVVCAKQGKKPCGQRRTRPKNNRIRRTRLGPCGDRFQVHAR